MYNHMRPMIVLGMKPQFILSAAMEGDLLILQVITAIADPNAFIFKFREGRGWLLFFLPGAVSVRLPSSIHL